METPPTIITLTLPTPEGGGITPERATASLLIQRGELAHMCQFHYNGNLRDLMDAIHEAHQALGLLEDNPPQVTLPPEPAPGKSSRKARKSKPKKKKPSLDDFPMDDDDEAIAPKAQKTLQVGAVVQIQAGAVDVDGDPVPFTEGNVCEIDRSTEPPRIWVESADGEYDVWLHESLLEVKTASRSSTKSPVKNSNQLTLFG